MGPLSEGDVMNGVNLGVFFSHEQQGHLRAVSGSWQGPPVKYHSLQIRGFMLALMNQPSPFLEALLIKCSLMHSLKLLM